MRVFLKAQPGPIATAGTRDEPPRTNGNGGSHGATGEASAFRELLTEFRNLTERYGQALLALGEARGEVAGLRSRVDQLEARLDLRLPPPLDAAPVAWESATIPASAPGPAPAMAPPITAPPAPVRRTSRPRKAPSPREAVAGFADALARAQDPNAADLGESRVEPEAAVEAVAQPPVEAPAATVAAPEELEPDMAVAMEPEPAVAEEIPPAPVAVADETPDEVAIAEAPVEEPAGEVEPPTYSAVVVEPDWFADGDFAWLDAAEREPTAPAEPSPEPSATEPDDAEQEPQNAIAPTEMQPLPSPELPAEPVHEPEPEPEPQSMPEPAPVFEAEAEFEPWQPPEPAAAEPSAAPDLAEAPEPPTMSAAVAVEEIEEAVMWIGAEPEPTPIVRDEPPQEHRAEVDAWPAVDSVRPPLAMTEDELARLALDEGWDDTEVAAIRAMITPIPSATVDLPGAAELHEAMAALEAVPVRSDPAYDVSRQWAKPAPDDDEPARQDDWAFEAEPAPPPAPASRPPTDVTSALRRSAADPGWLRRRQGPAAAAYRRLRRLFPG